MARHPVAAHPRARLLTAVALLASAVAMGAPPQAAADDPRIMKEPAITALAPDFPKLLSARQAHSLLVRHPDMLLIDVRTFGETVFGGVPAPIHRHIPYVLVDEAHEFDEKAKRYKLTPNPDFPRAFELMLKAAGRPRETTMILICAVGERSMKAASYLAKLGYPSVYAVADGIDGLDDIGASQLIGWRRAGLPWAAEMTQAQAYKSPSM